MDIGFHNNLTMAVSLLNIVSIGFLGGLGAVARYLMSNWGSRFNLGGIPVGTLLVNGVGSLLLGFMLGSVLLTEGLSERTRLALTVGFLGGFTTFSTFSVETVQLLEQGRAVAALTNVGLQVVLGLLMAAIGFYGARAVFC